MNVRNYGNYIAEASAVLSDELNPRLKQYLEEESFIEYLSPKLASLESGEIYELKDIPKSEYGLREEDDIWVKVDKSDPKLPKFMMWIMNDEYLYGGIDFNLAATILYNAGNEGSAIGYVGNILGGLFGAGDPGDSGTDESTVVAICGAMAAIAAEKSVDPKLYYDKLAEAFNEKYGSLSDFLETEFSGRAESAALAAFRQPIDPSVARGLNLGSIIVDIGLFALTGPGTAVFGALKGLGIAAKATRVGAGVVRVGSKLLKGPAAVAARFGGWVGLSAAKKTTYLGSVVKVGDEISYVNKAYKAGTVNKCKILSITEKEVKLQNVARGNTFTASLDDFVLGVPAATGNRILDAAKITTTKASLALATKKVSDIVGASGSDVNAEMEDVGYVARGAELLGWYDTLAADPNQFITSLEGSDAAGLAEAILDLKKGSGLFGNTTDQEELAMALIILSLTPDGAKQVKDEYAKIDNSPVYSVIDDELGGDMGLFAKSYWSGCTETENLAGPIKGILSKIRKK
jgi:hypothetical protein